MEKTSKIPSLDVASLAVAGAHACDNMAGGQGIAADASVVTQREMKTTSSAPPKATAREVYGWGTQKSCLHYKISPCTCVK
jgi:hypothetical protein